MSPERNELEELRQRLAALTQRVYRLEQQAGLEPLKPVLAPAAAPPAAPPAPGVPLAAPGPGVVAPAAAKASPPAQSLESRIGAHWLNRIGIAEAWRQTHSPEEVVKAADKALYAAKREGRNRVVVWPGPSARETRPQSRALAKARTTPT